MKLTKMAKNGNPPSFFLEMTSSFMVVFFSHCHVSLPRVYFGVVLLPIVTAMIFTYF